MEGTNALGKVGRDVFQEVIFRELGRPDESVVLGPRFGVDFGVLRLGDHDLIVEVDPVYVVPEYGWDRSAWFAVNILASDVAVSGVPPRYLFIDLNLPPRMSNEELRTLWHGIHRECSRLGIAVVAGHTGRYEGVDYPMIGGATMVGVTGRDEWVAPTMARPGDVVIMTKGAAVEAAGILASMFPAVLERRYGREFARRAQDIFWLQSVVDDALTLSGLGLRKGVTAMHDATEYGVWGALIDVAEASGVSIVVDRSSLFIRDDVEKVLRAFEEVTGVRIDPFAAISEGTLIATVSPDKAEKALSLLKAKGIEARVIGRVEDGSGVYLDDGASLKKVVQPAEDPFWPTFFRVLDLARRGEL